MTSTNTNHTLIVNNQTLAITEYDDRRVITLADVDRVHDRPEGTAKRNFNTNKKHFVEGEDYYQICANEIRTHKIADINDKFHGSMIFLTEFGYLLLVKSLTDDLAWKVQRELVQTYFRSKQANKASVLKPDFDTFDFNSFFTGYINHIVNQAMQPYVTSLNQGISEIKNGIVNSRNELINGQKMIYNELRAHGTINTEYVKSDIKDEIISLVKSIQSQQSDKFTTDKEVLSYFYTQMRNVYGVVTEQAVKDYKQKYNIDGRVSVLNAIVDDDNLASIFKNLLADFLRGLQQESGGFESDSDIGSDICHVESKAYTADSNRLVGDVKDIATTLSPFDQLVAKRNDKSMYGCATARMVYKHMEQLEDIDWTYHKSYYKRKNRLSKKAVFTKMDVIKSNKKLSELFEKSVLEMLKCKEVK